MVDGHELVTDHEYVMIDGRWRCVTEDVDADNCTDPYRCSDGCVCNSSEQEARHQGQLLRYADDEERIDVSLTADQLIWLWWTLNNGHQNMCLGDDGCICDDLLDHLQDFVPADRRERMQ